MQASVTTVFRSAIEASSMPIRSARPAIAWRTTATFSAFAGSDIWRPDESTLVVVKLFAFPGLGDAMRDGQKDPRNRQTYRPRRRPDTQTAPAQTKRAR